MKRGIAVLVGRLLPGDRAACSRPWVGSSGIIVLFVLIASLGSGFFWAIFHKLFCFFLAF